MQRLREQTVKSRLDVIRNVAPMSEAFNEMHRRCETPLFVQVDEDMRLYPQALEKLVEEVERASEKTAIITAPLLDVQVDLPMYGVKIYRTEIVTRFPHRNTVSCEVTHNQDLQAAGYELIGLPRTRAACLGLHGKHYTPRTAFIRWRRLFLKRRRRGRPLWAAPWPARFLRRYRQSGSEIDLYSFLGALSALHGDLPEDREHDFRDRYEEFERIQEVLTSDRDGRETLREARDSVKGLASHWLRRLGIRLKG